MIKAKLELLFHSGAQMFAFDEFVSSVFGYRASETEEHYFEASSRDERSSANTGYGAVSGATPS